MNPILQSLQTAYSPWLIPPLALQEIISAWLSHMCRGSGKTMRQIFPRSKEMSTELHCSEMMGSVSDPGPFTEQTARGRAFLQKNGILWQPGTLVNAHVGLSQGLLSPGDAAQEPSSHPPVPSVTPCRPLLGVSVKSALRRMRYLPLGMAEGRAQL